MRSHARAQGRDREAGPALGDLASIVKAYDIRGVVPDQLDEGVAEAVGAAFARVTGAGTIVTRALIVRAPLPSLTSRNRGSGCARAKSRNRPGSSLRASL